MTPIRTYLAGFGHHSVTFVTTELVAEFRIVSDSEVYFHSDFESELFLHLHMMIQSLVPPREHKEEECDTRFVKLGVLNS